MIQANRGERFLSLFTIVRPGEGRAALRLCLLSFALMFSYYLLKVIREPLILAEGSAELKAYATAVQAVLLMLITPLFTHFYQRATTREEKHFLFHRTLSFFIPILIVFAVAFEGGLPIGILFYIWLGIFSVMTITLFWAFAADLLNPRTGRRLFPLFAAAAALGALLGAGFAGGIDRLLGHGGVMWLAAALLLIPLAIDGSVEALVPPDSRSYDTDRQTTNSSLTEGFEIIFKNRYLVLIMVFVVVLNLVNTNGEYILASFVTDRAATASGGKDLFITEFYSNYIFLVTLLSFLIQLFVVARVYDRIGISGALYITPLIMLASYSLLSVLPLFVAARWALIAENSINYSLQMTTRHALFLPVSRSEKYIAKHTIETFFFRLGDVISGGIIYLGSVMLALGVLGFIQLNILLSVALLVLSHTIGQRHKGILRENLQNSPPRVGVPIRDVAIPAGEVTRLQMHADTFIDPDRGDALRYQASTVAGGSLPGWIKFDALNRHFEFRPPRNSYGRLQIRVAATDFDGLNAEVFFTVEYGSPGR